MANKRQRKKQAKKDLYDEEPTGLAGMAFKVARDVKPGEKPVTSLYGGNSGLADFASNLQKRKKDDW